MEEESKPTKTWALMSYKDRTPPQVKVGDLYTDRQKKTFEMRKVLEDRFRKELVYGPQQISSLIARVYGTQKQLSPTAQVDNIRAIENLFSYAANQFEYLRAVGAAGTSYEGNLRRAIENYDATINYMKENKEKIASTFKSVNEEQLQKEIDEMTGNYKTLKTIEELLNVEGFIENLNYTKELFTEYAVNALFATGVFDDACVKTNLFGEIDEQSAEKIAKAIQKARIGGKFDGEDANNFAQAIVSMRNINAEELDIEDVYRAVLGAIEKGLPSKRTSMEGEGLKDNVWDAVDGLSRMFQKLVTFPHLLYTAHGILEENEARREQFFGDTGTLETFNETMKKYIDSVGRATKYLLQYMEDFQATGAIPMTAMEKFDKIIYTGKKVDRKRGKIISEQALHEVKGLEDMLYMRAKERGPFALMYGLSALAVYGKNITPVGDIKPKSLTSVERIMGDYMEAMRFVDYSDEDVKRLALEEAEIAKEEGTSTAIVLVHTNGEKVEKDIFQLTKDLDFLDELLGDEG